MLQVKRAAEQALKHAQARRRGDGPRWTVPTGDQIRALRLRLDLTQREFARRFGFDLDSVKSWETSRRIPDQSKCLLLVMIEMDAPVVAALVEQAAINQSLQNVPAAELSEIESVLELT